MYFARSSTFDAIAMAGAVGPLGKKGAGTKLPPAAVRKYPKARPGSSERGIGRVASIPRGNRIWSCTYLSQGCPVSVVTTLPSKAKPRFEYFQWMSGSKG